MSVKAYMVTIHTTSEYEARVFANTANEAKEMARLAEWDDIWACDKVIRSTIKRSVRSPEDDPLASGAGRRSS